MTEHLPHPYAICAIWLLGTMLPFAFLTILGDASADAFGATAIVSMMPNGFEPWYSRRARALHTAGLEDYRKRSPAAQAQHSGGSGAHDARLGELFLGLKRTCMKPISNAPLADLPPTHRAEPDTKTSPF